jgi:hypothetical protein
LGTDRKMPIASTLVTFYALQEILPASAGGALSPLDKYLSWMSAFCPDPQTSGQDLGRRPVEWIEESS